MQLFFWYILEMLSEFVLDVKMFGHVQMSPGCRNSWPSHGTRTKTLIWAMVHATHTSFCGHLIHTLFKQGEHATLTCARHAFKNGMHLSVHQTPDLHVLGRYKSSPTACLLVNHMIQMFRYLLRCTLSPLVALAGPVAVYALFLQVSLRTTRMRLAVVTRYCMDVC